MDTPIELLSKSATLIFSSITLFFGAHQWSAMRQRQKLKADLEILKLLQDPALSKPDGESASHMGHIVKRIQLRVNKVYPDPNRTDFDWSDLFIGSLLISIAVFAFYQRTRWNGSWMIPITVGAVICFIGGGISLWKGVHRPVKNHLRKSR